MQDIPVMPSFQFLLGRLETSMDGKTGTDENGFQFLLGRLETTRAGIQRTRDHWFQFLLGRLETCSISFIGADLDCFNSS